jgi:predicted nucleic acid-binding protein
MGRLIFQDGAKIYLDTSIVIYSVMTDPKYWETLRPMWQKSQDREVNLISSELLILETLVVPLRTNNVPILEIYEDLFSEDIQLQPISESILRTAAQLRATTRLKTPDAIHAATAIESRCTIFFTNDAGFRNIPRLPVVILDQVMGS